MYFRGIVEKRELKLFKNWRKTYLWHIETSFTGRFYWPLDGRVYHGTADDEQAALKKVNWLVGKLTEREERG